MTDRKLHAEALMRFDQPYRERGIVAGMDEVGRGPLAGPVVTACVIMPAEPLLTWVDDSKKLSEKRRESVYSEIMQIAKAFAFGRIEPEEIDRINILQATRKAMVQAAEQVRADFYLIDAVSDLGLAGTEVPIIKGDANSYSIAAASILAKVCRDAEMIRYDALYPEYGFARNKGYGTKEHIDALRKYGPCPIHRRTFIGNFI